MKLTYVTKALFLGTSSLLLFACGNGDETETDGNQVEVPDDQSSEGEENADENDMNDDDSNGNDTNDENGNDTDTDDQDDEAGDDEPDESENGNDTLANMTEEERVEHYLSLAREPDELDEAVFDHLELRGLHENTIIYGGRVNPGSTVYIFGDSGHSFDVTVNEEGFFSFTLNTYNFAEGDELPLLIEHDDLESHQTFLLPFHSPEEGMDIIQPLSDTTQWQEQLLEEIDEFPEIHPNALIYEHAAGRELDALFYALEGEEMVNGYRLGLEEPNEEGEFLMNLLRYPEAGENVMYHVVADGVIATAERQVQELTSEIKEAGEAIQNETDITLQTDTEEAEFQTVPNASIIITFPYDQLREETESDESGEFTFTLPSRAEDLESGDSIYFTIIDENGSSETVEVIVE